MKKESKIIHNKFLFCYNYLSFRINVWTHISLKKFNHDLSFFSITKIFEASKNIFLVKEFTKLFNRLILVWIMFLVSS